MTQLVTLRRHGFQSRHGEKECSNIANLKRVAADRKRKQDCAQQQHGHEHEARHMRRFPSIGPNRSPDRRNLPRLSLSRFEHNVDNQMMIETAQRLKAKPDERKPPSYI